MPGLSGWLSGTGFAGISALCDPPLRNHQKCGKTSGTQRLTPSRTPRCIRLFPRRQNLCRAAYCLLCPLAPSRSWRLRSRPSLSPANGTIPRFSFHIRRLLIALSAPHVTLHPRTFHNLPKSPNCFLNRLPLTQHDLDCHASSPGTTEEFNLVASAGMSCCPFSS